MERIRKDTFNRKAFEIDCQRNSFGTPTPHTHALTELKRERKKKKEKKITQKYV